MTNFKGMTDLFEDLKEVFDEELACEIPEHGRDKHHPNADEPGEWYITSKCDKCGTGRTILACNTFHNSIIEAGPDEAAQCIACGSMVISKTFITSMIRR